MRIRLLFFFFFSASGLFAQFSIGPTAGIHFSEWTGISMFTDENGEPLEAQFFSGYNVGVVAEIELGDRFFVQPQIHFLQKGVAFDSGEGLINLDAKLWINYLDLVALAKYKYVGESVGGYLAVGPQLGYAVTGKSVVEFTFNGQTEKEEEDLDLEEEEFNRVEFGMSFGGGVVVPLENGPELFLDIRYLLGLTNINNNDGFNSEMDIRNQGIGISVGALFAIGKQ